MYEIDVKDVAHQLESLLAAIGKGEEVVLTEAQRPIAKVTKIAEDELPSQSDRGAMMVRILEQLAASNAFSEITDPVAWQCDIRRDRLRPGRD
ncbi:MAG: hypothetical protein MOB07_08050 [Acidobacteria bacterium]|nr:hypothetical protein [Acidobacteriota bacterium]